MLAQVGHDAPNDNRVGIHATGNCLRSQWRIWIRRQDSKDVDRNGELLIVIHL
jgi:hypothetical protein